LTEGFTVNTNEQNTSQHFQGASAPPPPPCPCPRTPMAVICLNLWKFWIFFV